MKRSKVILILSALIFSSAFFSCSEGGTNEDPPIDPPIDQNEPPAKAVGILPANGEPCSDYEEVVADDSKVLVAFQWNSAQFAQSYVLIVLENGAEVFRNTFNTLQAQVELDRGKTYTWRLISVNGEGETNGDTFSFTTPGTPVGNFAPYAADIEIAFDSGTLEMSISWMGNDEDGDTLTYDVKVSEGNNVIVEELDLNAGNLEALIYMPGEEYTVEVVSRDPFGNFSVSEATEEAPE